MEDGWAGSALRTVEEGLKRAEEAETRQYIK
jgi:hypothetical protein